MTNFELYIDAKNQAYKSPETICFSKNGNQYAIGGERAPWVEPLFNILLDTLKSEGYTIVRTTKGKSCYVEAYVGDKLPVTFRVSDHAANALFDGANIKSLVDIAYYFTPSLFRVSVSTTVKRTEPEGFKMGSEYKLISCTETGRTTKKGKAICNYVFERTEICRAL